MHLYTSFPPYQSAISVALAVLLTSGVSAFGWPKQEEAGLHRSLVDSAAGQTSLISPQSGSVSGNMYTSDFFGFTYQFPKGWTIREQDSARSILPYWNGFAREGLASGPSRSDKVVLDAQLNWAYPLLVVLEDERRERSHLNPGIVIAAIDMSIAQGSRTHLQNLRAVLSQQVPNLRVLREPTESNRGGNLFIQLDTSVESATGIIECQSYNAIEINGYVLDFILAAQNPEHLESLLQTLNTVEFNSRKGIPVNTAQSASSEGAHSREIQSSVQILTPTEGINFSPYILDPAWIPVFLFKFGRKAGICTQNVCSS